MTSLAFLGTGTMGLPMARHLVAHGFEVRAWNRSPERARPLEADGAVVCEQASEAVRGTELMLTMLSDADAVLEVARSSIDHLAAGGIWIQCSTIGVDGFRQCQELATQAGVALVDAPVLGTKAPAEQAKLVILASGPRGCPGALHAGFRRHRPAHASPRGGGRGHPLQGRGQQLDRGPRGRSG